MHIIKPTIKQMINCLLGNMEIALHVVHIGVDIKYFEIRNMQGYDSYNIPQSSVLQIGGIDKYLKGISYLIRLNCHLPKDDSIIFLFRCTLSKFGFQFSPKYFIFEEDYMYGG